jgi:hypothetical protein
MSSGSDYGPSIAGALYPCKCSRVVVVLAIWIALVAAITLRLIAIAPRDPGRRRTTSVLSLSLLAIGVIGFVAAAPVEEGPDEPEWLGTLIAGAFASLLLAVVPALTGFYREEGKLAGLALGLSSALPAAIVVGYIACFVTRDCFD